MWSPGPTLLSWLWFSLWFTPSVNLSLLSVIHFLGQVTVRGTGIKEREPFSLYFQFTLCLYLPCPVLCHGNEEGWCNQPVLASLCESSVSHAERWYQGVRFPGTTPHASFLFHSTWHRTLASIPLLLTHPSNIAQTIHWRFVWRKERATALNPKAGEATDSGQNTGVAG